ncbi:MobC family replication-relaxation protein [Citrobacter koseri]|uniref:MobC family replication-relaxation protein n=1 Tax=Citrobacter koseri TaxID=545 RepID=UPI001F45AAAC|nr:MobC family replication-relaxation protein [Citrobacter koseri]
MLLTSAAERRERNHEKIRILLNFLKEETYSDFSRLMLLFGFKDYKSLYSLLAKVTKMGLIQKHVMASNTMNIAIWGITNDGLAIVLTPEDDIMPSRFEPYKLTGWTLDHHLDNQLARLILEKKGATGWIHGDRKNFLSNYKFKHRPDGLIKLPGGKIVAIETERRLKTKARYQSIMASHLLARTEKHWTYVFYIVPDEQKKRALIMHFDSVKHVIINGLPSALEDKHRGIFRFYTLDELKQLDISNYQ